MLRENGAVIIKELIDPETADAARRELAGVTAAQKAEGKGLHVGPPGSFVGARQGERDRPGPQGGHLTPPGPLL